LEEKVSRNNYDAIKTLLYKKGYAYKDLEKTAGISMSSVTRFFSGQDLSERVLYKLESGLNQLGIKSKVNNGGIEISE